MTELVGAALTRKRGDTAPDTITATDAAGAAMDNTGFSYRLTINTDRAPDPAAGIGTELVSIAGQPQGASGGVIFPWTAMDADQAPGTYWYDIEQVDASGAIKTIAKNTYKFFMDVSK